MSHKQWLENEYQQWIEALQSSTVHNFKEHPMVKRMLGDFEWPDEFKFVSSAGEYELICKIENVGRERPGLITGTGWRMLYYARQVLLRNPASIVEIGGGVGEFYAILRALGYTGRYFIFDLPEVKAFQADYLAEVERQTGLDLPFYAYPKSYDFCVSFYALGEFDDELKSWYIENVVKKCAHGFIVWNPHSGASAGVDFPCEIKDEYPLLSAGNKQLEW
jgi:hypothetical protein